MCIRDRSYPEADDWTWEKFIEIGKKLTDEKAGIYGAYNPDWVHYNYMYAIDVYKRQLQREAMLMISSMQARLEPA